MQQTQPARPGSSRAPVPVRKNRIELLDELLIRFTPVQMALFAAVLSACLLVPVWSRFDIVSKDSVHLYLPLARLLQQGLFKEALSGPLGANFPLPLYELLTSLTARTGMFSLETSGRLVSALSFVLGAVGIFFLAEAVFRRRTISVVTLLLYLSNRMLLSSSVDCLKESLLVCIVVWGNYFIIKGIELGNRAVYLSIGAVVLLSGIMVRSTSLVFLLAWAVLWVVHKREGLLTRLLVVTLPVVLLVVLAVEYPALHVFRKSLSIKRTLGAAPSDMGVLAWAVELFRNFLKRTHYLTAFFGLWGLYALRRRRYAGHLAVSLAAFFLLFLARSNASFSDRYMLAVIIYMMPLAAAMVIHALETRPSRLVLPLAYAAILLCPLSWGSEAAASPDPDKLARKDAGRFILSRMGPGWDIITNREQVALYAEGNVIDVVKNPEEGDYERFAAYRNTDFKTETNRITLCDVFCNGKVLKPIVTDTLLEEDRGWIGMLARQGIQPDRTVRSISIYLPKTARK